MWVECGRVVVCMLRGEAMAEDLVKRGEKIKDYRVGEKLGEG